VEESHLYIPDLQPETFFCFHKLFPRDILQIFCFVLMDIDLRAGLLDQNTLDTYVDGIWALSMEE
jgi:hypothetical protein